MSYVIHGAPGSGSGIVEAVCAELGVAYEVRDLDARNDEHRRQSFAQINPSRKMPALALADGEIITESVAIVLTLDERHREHGVLPPPGSRQRAQALRWMCFAATEIYPLVEILDYPDRFAPAEQEDALRDRVQSLLQERWLIVERNIAGSPYMLDTGFCATDIYLAHLSGWNRGQRERLPKVVALTDAVASRPRLAPVYARHFPNTTAG